MDNEDFIKSISHLCDAVHSWAKSNGWWDGRHEAISFCDDGDLLPILGEDGERMTVQESLEKLNARNDAELLMLMVTELAEACEGLRHGNPPSEHIPEYSALEEELADVVIRIADMAGARGLRLGDAIVAKMAFNQGRPYRHGKKF